MSSELLDGVLRRDVRALAKALRTVDDRRPEYLSLLKALFPKTGSALVLGVTGNPGSGKSTLSDQLVRHYRSSGKTIAVLAVDPSSPITGGAILGDRIRMSAHFEDPGVFIRSLATRGHLGGLSRSARDMSRLLDAAGFDVVLMETVGVGQDELEVTQTAECTVLVSAPGLGDDVQAIKAGLLECADILVVNKGDRPGADAAMRDLEMARSLTHEVALNKESWLPPVLRAVATTGQGVREIAEAVHVHRKWLLDSDAGQQRREARARLEIEQVVAEAVVESALANAKDALTEAARRVVAREIDPYTAAERLVACAN